MHQHHTPRANSTRAIRNTPTRTSKKERSPNKLGSSLGHSRILTIRVDCSTTVHHQKGPSGTQPQALFASTVPHSDNCGSIKLNPRQLSSSRYLPPQWPCRGDLECSSIFQQQLHSHYGRHHYSSQIQLPPLVIPKLALVSVSTSIRQTPLALPSRRSYLPQQLSIQLPPRRHCSTIHKCSSCSKSLRE